MKPRTASPVRWSRSSLQSRVVLFLLALVLAPTLILGVSLYVRSTQILQSAVSSSSLTTLSQTAANVGFVLNEMRNVSLRIYQETRITGFLRDEATMSSAESEQGRIQVRSVLASMVGASDYVDGIHIETPSGASLSWSASQFLWAPTLRAKLRRLKGSGTIIHRTLMTSGGGRAHRVFLVRELRDINDLSRHLGFVAIEADERRIADIYRYRLPRQPGDFVIMDNAGAVVSTADRSRVGMAVSHELRRAVGSGTGNGVAYVNAENEEHAAVYFTEPKSGWKLIRTIPRRVFLKENAALREIMILGVLVTLVVCLAIGFMFSARIVRPIKTLSSLMGQVHGDNLDVRASVSGNDELATLAESFNRMTARIRRLLQEVYTGTIKRREAELKALQAQVHPHFLYNSLDAIYWMSRTEGAQETAEIVRALSMVFRLSLNRGDEFTTVGNELELLRNYMRIQGARYQDQMDFQITCDPGLEDMKVVKLVLQPLVENAIQHGLEPSGGVGSVTVRVWNENGRVVYEVADDGAGADESEITALLSEKADTLESDVSLRGFGLRNVQERIELHFGPGYGLEFSSCPGRGTKVRVEQPLISAEVRHAASHDR